MKLPYELDGREQTLAIAGRTFNLASGNVLVLTGDDAPEPVIHQRQFDAGRDADNVERFAAAYLQKYPLHEE